MELDGDGGGGVSADADALVLAARRQLQDKNIDAARQRFLQLPELEARRKRYLEDVLRDFYTAGLFDTQVLLSFLESLPSWQWTLDGCEVLHRVNEALRVPAAHSELKLHLQFPQLPLAFFLHKLMSHLEGSVRVRAESYWYQWVSPTIRAVVMGKEILIEALAKHELMYAPNNDFVFDHDRRNIFTWAKDWAPDQDKEKWRLIPANTQKDCFLIQSVRHDEYLYAADYAKFKRDDKGNARSRVFLWRKKNESPGASGHWQLIPLDSERRDVFALYNAYQKEFLYAPSEMYDNDRRHVLTTRDRQHDASWLDERQWRLMPSSFSSMEQGIEAFFVKNYPLAVEKLTEALQTLPDNTEHVKCFAYRMTANLRMRHFDKIEEDFLRIQDLGGDKAAIFHGLAHLWEESATYLATVADQISENPFFMHHQLARGDHFFVRKDYQAAVVCYQEAATAVSPSNPPTSSVSTSSADSEESRETKRKRALAYVCCAKCFYALDEVENAQQYLSIAQDIGDLPVDSEATILLWMGKCKRKQAEYDEALGLLERAFDRASAAATLTTPSANASLKRSVLMEMKVVGIMRQKIYDTLFGRSSDVSHDEGVNGGANGVEAANEAEKTLQQVMDLFMCPLSLELMDDPVMTPTGNTYERAMIERHLGVNGKFDPLTRAPLTKAQLYPNRALKLLMETMLSEHRLGLLLASCAT